MGFIDNPIPYEFVPCVSQDFDDSVIKSIGAWFLESDSFVETNETSLHLFSVGYGIIYKDAQPFPPGVQFLVDFTEAKVIKETGLKKVLNTFNYL